MEDNKNITFNEEMSERVDRFLRREMNESEATAFKEELKTNAGLKECYQRQFNLMRAIKFEKMTAIMKDKEMELSTKRIETHPKHQFIYVMSTLAVAASMVGGVFIWDDSRTRAVGTEALAVVWKGSDPIDDCIKKGEYQKAIDLIDEQLGKTYELGDDPEANAAYTQEMNDLKYRKALVYLKMGKKRAAKTILKELDDKRSHELLNKLLW